MDTTLVLTINAFMMAAVVLAVPVFVIAGIWVTALELRRLACAQAHGHSLGSPINQY